MVRTLGYWQNILALATAKADSLKGKTDIASREALQATRSWQRQARKQIKRIRSMRRRKQ